MYQIAHKLRYLGTFLLWNWGIEKGTSEKECTHEVKNGHEYSTTKKEALTTLSKLEGTGQTFRIWKMKKWKQNGYHTSHRSTIHQLKLCKSLSFNICVRAWSCWFPTPNLQLHIFYLYSDKKKIYLPNNHIIEMVPGQKRGIWVTCRFPKWPTSQNRRSR